MRDVIAVLLAEEGYAVTAVSSAEAALDAAQAAEFSLAISDVRMPGKDGFWFLDRVRELHPDMAVVMLTAFGDTEAAVERLRNGAADYLLKPPKVTDLIRAIERALGRRRLELARQRYRKSLENRVREKTAELSRTLGDLQATYSQTLWSLVAALDAREHETSDYLQRVVQALAVAGGSGSARRICSTSGAGRCCTTSARSAPDAILLKPAKLTPAEWDEMRKHPQIGFNILQSVEFLDVPAQVLCHQERFDGGGYPRGLAGEAIPIGARIFAIADCFDAMTSDRPYRKGGTVEAARAEIVRCAGTQFDPRCADAFLSMSPGRLAELARTTAARPLI